MMERLLCITVASLLVGTILTEKTSTRKRPDPAYDRCANVYCGEGRECVEGLSEEPVCDCIERCEEPPKPLCANDGKTYENTCEMYKEACLSSMKLSKKSDGPCKEKPMNVKRLIDGEDKRIPQPVVCFEKDRDLLRDKLIGWLRHLESGIQLEKRPFSAILKDLFMLLDEDNDTKIDTMELMQFLEKNDSIIESLGKDRHVNPLIRGLCVDALIALTDKDSDFKLGQNEFLRCLDPDFKPPKKQCSMEGKTYSDGDEIAQGCNTCACACGYWVCTSVKCDENTVYKKFKTSDNKVKSLNKIKSVSFRGPRKKGKNAGSFFILN